MKSHRNTSAERRYYERLARQRLHVTNELAASECAVYVFAVEDRLELWSKRLSDWTDDAASIEL
ncbi:MAG: hypothetical protein ABI614_07445 [Planctomycetota bacterium]